MFSQQGWNPQVLIALITAITALLVAIFQAVASRRAAQKIENLKAQLERQKQLQVEYLRKYLERVVEGKGQELQAFRELLQPVQVFRDKLRRVSSNPHSYDKKILAREMNDLLNTILDAFARNQIHFDEDDCLVAHKLKSKCGQVVMSIDNYLMKHKKGEPLSFPQELQTLLDEVASLQANLRQRALFATKGFTESLKASVDPGVDDA